MPSNVFIHPRMFSETRRLDDLEHSTGMEIWFDHGVPLLVSHADAQRKLTAEKKAAADLMNNIITGQRPTNRR